MKVVLLAGGFGTRISEESSTRPKPMVEVGGRPILWHIMKIYSQFGFNEFIVCLGFKGYVIKEYFSNYFLHNSDVTIDLRTNETQIHSRKAEPWKITLVDTSESTMTGGRLKRIQPYLDGRNFFMTYGDGVADIDVEALSKFHRSHGRLATVTAVQPPGRWGTLGLENSNVLSFQEKPLGDGGWVNGGFFVLSPKVLDLIKDDSTVWEREPLETLAMENQLQAYFHEGFWQPVDTLRDKQKLEELWSQGKAAWKVWD